jgi:hypothetical protein
MNSRMWAAIPAALAVVLAWWGWWPSTHNGIEEGATQRKPDQALALRSYSAVLPAESRPPTPGEPMSRQGASVGHATMPIRLQAPATLNVGEQAELAVSMGSVPPDGEVHLTIRFDPDVLQARAVSPGEWAVGINADLRFAFEIAEAADRVHIRYAAVGGRASSAAGTMAVVQFQAVSPGTSKVWISEATLKGRSGQSMPILLSSASLQVMAEASSPAAQIDTHKDASPAETAENGD